MSSFFRSILTFYVQCHLPKCIPKNGDCQGTEIFYDGQCWKPEEIPCLAMKGETLTQNIYGEWTCSSNEKKEEERNNLDFAAVKKSVCSFYCSRYNGNSVKNIECDCNGQ